MIQSPRQKRFEERGQCRAEQWADKTPRLRKGEYRYNGSIFDSYTNAGFPIDPSSHIRTVVFRVKNKDEYLEKVKPRLKELRALPVNSGWLDYGMAANFRLKEFAKVRLAFDEDEYVIPSEKKART